MKVQVQVQGDAKQKTILRKSTRNIFLRARVHVGKLNLAQLTDCENRFQRDFVQFARLWNDTEKDWADVRRDRFQREHLSSIGPSLNRLTAAIHEFASAIHAADLELNDPKKLD